MRYFAELVLLVLSEICHFYQFRLYYLLTLLCVLRAWLTVQRSPAFDANIIPVLQNYLFIKLNDIVVVAIWVLFPLLCLRSILGLYYSLGMNRNSFRQLFFIAAGDVSPQALLKPMPILAILLTGASATYIPRLAFFIYDQWTAEYTFLVQSLQIYPAMLRTIQTFYQGMYLLLAYTKSSILKVATKENLRDCKEQLEAHIMLNMTLVFHCVCICAVTGSSSTESNGIVFNLAMGEILYRSWASVAFSNLRKKLEESSHECVDYGVKSLGDDATITDSVVAREESHNPDTSAVSEMVHNHSQCKTFFRTKSHESMTASEDNALPHVITEVTNQRGNAVTEEANYNHCFSEMVCVSFHNTRCPYVTHTTTCESATVCSNKSPHVSSDVVFVNSSARVSRVPLFH